MKRLNILIEEHQDKAITKLANAANVSFSEILRQALDNYIELKQLEINKLPEAARKVAGKRRPHRLEAGTEEKFCSQCDMWHPLSKFHKQKQNWDGLYAFCKQCKKKLAEKYPKTVVSPEAKQKNNETRRCKRKNNPTWAKKQIERAKQYNKTNRKKVLENKRSYSTRSDVKAARNIKDKLRRQQDVNFRLRANLRSRLWSALKGNPKSDHTFKLIGCSVEELKKHLENKFTTEMTWDNYGSVWEVDHIIPCSKFDLSKKENQLICFHFNNLQPLTTEDNRRKKDSIITT